MTRGRDRDVGGFWSPRLLLDEPSRIDDIETLAGRLAWRESRDIQDGGIREVSWDIGQDAVLHYVEEARAAACFVQVEADSQASVDRVVAVVIEQLHPISADEVVGAVDRADSSQDLAIAILRMGLIAPAKWEVRTYTRLNAALYDDSPHVRAAAVAAVAYRHWPEFRSLIRYMAVTDSDPNVRRDAEILSELAYVESADSP
jgi:hypothetical protein